MRKKRAPRRSAKPSKPARKRAKPSTGSLSTKEAELLAREKLLVAREAAVKAGSERQLAIDQMRIANEQLVFATLRAESAMAVADEASAAAHEDRAALEREAELREKLMAIVGHDLRTPLASVLMATQYLLRRNEFEGRNREVLTAIEHSAARMRDLIENLIELARVYRGAGLPIRLQPTDLKDICESVVRELELGRELSGRFICEFHGDTKGYWDPERLAQIVSNLAGNALDHGDETRKVTLRARGDGDAVVLEVHNHGVISEASTPVLFEPFRRGSASGDKSHLGLGLYIAHQLVRSHQGTIDIDSSEKKGTTFRVTLPRKPEQR